MTGIVGWFFAYLFFMAVELFFRSLTSLWFCAGALGAWTAALLGRTAEEQLLVFLFMSAAALWVIGAVGERRRA